MLSFLLPWPLDVVGKSFFRLTGSAKFRAVLATLGAVSCRNTYQRTLGTEHYKKDVAGSSINFSFGLEPRAKRDSILFSSCAGAEKAQLRCMPLSEGEMR